MFSDRLISDLKRDEGLELEAYPDPITHSDPWTIGYGCTGEGISEGVVWTQEKAETELTLRVQAIYKKLIYFLPWIGCQLDPIRTDVLVNMAYNLGPEGLLHFHQFLDLMKESKWEEAADDMLHTLWAKQVPKRAKRLSEQVRTGVHQD